MIIQMTGGGFKVFNDDTGQFIGAFNDKEFAEKVNEKQRNLTGEELEEFSDKIIAVPNTTGSTESSVPSEEVALPPIEAEITPTPVKKKRKAGRPKKKK